jgi:hypothetical protein
MRNTFCRLVLGIDRRLFLANVQGIMIIDGTGDSSCGHYIRVFRGLNLSGRQLAMEPFFQRRPGKEFCWSWYEDCIDPDGPQPV